MVKKNHVIILLLLISLIALAGCKPLKQQPPQHYETLYVSLGEEFTLHKNQTAVIEAEDFSVRVVEFYNSPCRGVCVWSGVGIRFEYNHNGETLSGTDLAYAFGYQTDIIDTDHETFALLKVEKMEQ